MFSFLFQTKESFPEASRACLTLAHPREQTGSPWITFGEFESIPNIISALSAVGVVLGEGTDSRAEGMLSELASRRRWPQSLVLEHL